MSLRENMRVEIDFNSESGHTDGNHDRDQFVSTSHNHAIHLLYRVFFVYLLS
jgi:hypothetical protein